MEIEQGRIPGLQLFFLTAGFVMGSALTVTFANNIAKQDTWLVVVSGTAIAFALLWIYLKLSLMFPGKNLVQINDLVYGPLLGKLVSIINIYWIVSLIPQHMRYIGDFFLSYFMPETPMVAILIPFTLICIWAARKGIEVIARMSSILVVITAITSILIFVFLLKNIKLDNFLPLYELSGRELIQGTNIILTITYCDLLALMMVIPYVNKFQEIKKSLFFGLSLGAVTIVYVTLQYIAVLGVTATIMTSPFFGAVRLINIADIFTRLDLLVATALLDTVFLKVSVLLYATELSLAQLFRMQTYLPLGFPVGIICISLTILLFDSTVEQFSWGQNIWPINALPFMVLLPVLSLLIAKTRKMFNKKGGSL